MIRMFYILALIFSTVFAWRRQKNDKKHLICTTQEGRGEEERWVKVLHEHHGEFAAKECFKHVSGLPGYPLSNAWVRFLGVVSGPKMDVVITNSTVLFFDPVFSPNARITEIGISTIKHVRSDYFDGSKLVIELADGRIKCDTGRQLGAKAMREMLKKRI